MNSPGSRDPAASSGETGGHMSAVTRTTEKKQMKEDHDLNRGSENKCPRFASAS